MKEIKKEFKTLLIKRLQGIALGVSGEWFRVIEIPPTEDGIGYTKKGHEIHVSFENEYTEEMDKHHHIMFVEGVFAHELMHQLMTDFTAFEKITKEMPNYVAHIQHTIFNIMEDPAIEYQAHNYFGGHLLRSLRFSIRAIYKNSKEVETDHPLTQFLNAFIQYGDGGFIKTPITDSVAKKCFFECLPLFDKCIEEPDCNKRIGYAQQVFELSKPLWEEDAKSAEELEKLLNDLAQMMQDSGKSTEGSNDGAIAPEDCDSSSDSESEKMKGRRTITVEKMEKSEEGEESDSDSSGNPSKDGKPSKGGKSGKSESKDANGEGSEESGKDSDSDSSDDSSKEGKSSKDEDSSKDGKSDSKGKNNSDPENTESNSNSSADAIKMHSEAGGKVNPTYGEEKNASEEAVGPDEFIEDSYTLTEEDIAAIEKEIEACLKLGEEEERAEQNDPSAVRDFPEISNGYKKNIRCLNTTVEDMSSYANQYSRLKASMSGDIKLLENQLKRILRNDREERTYRQSGRVSVKRLQSSRMTTRIYTKGVNPREIDDLSVLLLVDVSGSMSWGNKDAKAKMAAIGLAEVFNDLKIPFKVMTFSADMGGYDAVHTHYVNWKSSQDERIKLLNIGAGGNNFDGYSIRYAGKVMAKRNELHKLIIVLSDGQPACSNYRGTNGLSDTKNAVREIKKEANVIGIAIDANVDELYSIYGNSFVEMRDLSNMFSSLGNVIKKEIKSWE